MLGNPERSSVGADFYSNLSGAIPDTGGTPNKIPCCTSPGSNPRQGTSPAIAVTQAGPVSIFWAGHPAENPVLKKIWGH